MEHQQLNAVARRQIRSVVPMRMRRFIRIVRKTLLQFDTGDRRTLADFSRAAAGFIWLTRFYYFFTLYGIATFLRFDNAFSSNSPTDPLWPINLLTKLVSVELLSNVTAFSVAGSAVSLLAAVYLRMLIWRLGVFLYLLLFSALQNSYGFINHGNHILLYISFALLFMPSVDDVKIMSRKDVMSCITVFWLVQSLILFSYSLSGVWKITRSNFDLFASDGMIRILLNHALPDTQNIPPLLPFIARHEYLAQLMFIVTVYVQFFALFALFRPHLHRPFGIMLILFHVGSGLLMNISFSRNILFVGLFLVLSPMAPARFSLSGMLQSLPLIGIPFRAYARRQTPAD